MYYESKHSCFWVTASHIFTWQQVQAITGRSDDDRRSETCRWMINSLEWFGLVQLARGWRSGWRLTLPQGQGQGTQELVE